MSAGAIIEVGTIVLVYPPRITGLLKGELGFVRELNFKNGHKSVGITIPGREGVFYMAPHELEPVGKVE